MTATMARPILEIGDVARALGVSVETVRRWDREGDIAPAPRTSSGRRIFTTEDVEEIRRWREARKTAADAPDAA